MAGEKVHVAQEKLDVVTQEKRTAGEQAPWREITKHHANEANKALRLTADPRDENNGNASHHYEIEWSDQEGASVELELPFQHGPIKEHGVNGITNEVLLAIVVDRLQSFQLGKYACRENAIAITKVEEALHWLESRTQEREARGVEGTSAV